MYESILVATDGSPDANSAVTHALEQAEQHDGALHAIFVVNTERYPEPVLGSVELENDEVEKWGQKELKAIADRAEALGIEVTTQTRHGKPSEEIINLADEIEADLIVLGYHGHSQSDTQQIGSVTDRVVQSAGRPVLIAT